MDMVECIKCSVTVNTVKCDGRRYYWDDLGDMNSRKILSKCVWCYTIQK